MRNTYKYIKTQVEKFLNDTKNNYLFISQRPYKGKTDEKGNIILKPGANLTLQIMEDISEPLINCETGEVLDNNLFETFEVTIVDCPYPLPIKKGERVRLDEFIPEHSYYINFNALKPNTGIGQQTNMSQKLLT